MHPILSIVNSVLHCSENYFVIQKLETTNMSHLILKSLFHCSWQCNSCGFVDVSKHFWSVYGGIVAFEILLSWWSCPEVGRSHAVNCVCPDSPPPHAWAWSGALSRRLLWSCALMTQAQNTLRSAHVHIPAGGSCDVITGLWMILVELILEFNF